MQENDGKKTRLRTPTVQCIPWVRPAAAVTRRWRTHCRPIIWTLQHKNINDVSQKKIVHLGTIIIIVVCYYDTAYYLYDPA